MALKIKRVTIIEMPAHDPYDLPSDLPVPIDDGACNHLTGMEMPPIALPSTSNTLVDLLACSRQRAVFFFYPRTGKPGVEPLKGWNEIPGARGCTPQTCSFRDFYTEFRELHTQIYGISTQETSVQQEFHTRNQLPFDLLSDSELQLTRALHLPTFEVDSHTFVKRLALIVEEGRIEKVFYPVFPPDKNADEVLNWLIRNRSH